MNLRYWVLLLVSFFMLSGLLSAQSEDKNEAQSEGESERSDYALLWEITGNGLEEPSYLFGSMHVRYNAVFEFPDSLYICLQACDAIANEVHLDSAMQRFYEVYYGREELVVDSLYKEVTAQKSAKTDSLDQLYEVANPSEDFDIRSFFKGLIRLDDIEERGFNRTMLDAHLMETARSWGKELYGLEKIDEHMYEPEYQLSAPTPLKSLIFGNSLSTLLDIYYQGDIASVETFMRASPDAATQLALIPRNYIMCNSMERIMQENKERLFTVVGTAHLPGAEGVIQILKDRGYHLRKVEATFTGLRDSVLVEDTPRKWPRTIAKNNTFAFAMPWDFQYQQIDGSATSYYAFDIGQGLNYLMMKTALLPNAHEDIDEWFFGDDGYVVESKEEITHQGLPGYQYELSRSGSEPEFFRGYTFIVDQALYYLQVGAYKQEELDSNTNVNSFLQQFEVTKFNNEKWVTVTDTLGGFTARLPNNFSYSRAFLNDSYYGDKSLDYPHHIYLAGFSQEKASVWVQYYDQQTGDAPVAATERLSNVKDELINLYGIDFEVVARDTIDGFPYWDMEGQYWEENITVKVKALSRGNRLYLISCLDTPSGKLTKKFLPSFKLLPLGVEYPDQAAELVNGYLKSWLPANFTEEKVDLSYTPRSIARQQYKITAQDEAAAANYQVDVFELPALFGSLDTAGIFEEILQYFLLESDSVYNRKTVLVQDQYPGIELYCDSPNKQVDQLIQLYIAGQYWVRKKVYASAEYLQSERMKQFLYADEWSPHALEINQLSDRSNELILQLQSEDSLVIANAYPAFDTKLTVNAANAAAFADLLLDNHWEATQPFPDDMRLTVLKGLRTKSEDGLETIDALFQRAEAAGELRRSILVYLSQEIEKDESSKDLYFSLLQSDKKLSSTASDDVFLAFLNSQQLFLEHWPQFELLLKNGQEPLCIWEAAAGILSSDTTNHALILASQDVFVERGAERLESASSSLAETKAILELYELLPSDPRITQQVNRIFEQTEMSEATVLAAGYLMSQGQAIAKSKVKQIVAHEDLRITMIRMLNKHDQLGLLAKKSYNRESLARSLFLEKMALDEDGEVSKVELLETQEVLFKDEPKIVYVFSFKLDEEEDLLGVAGFFSTDLQERSFDDGEWINYTLYTIPSRRRSDKVAQLVKELENEPVDYDFDFDFDLDY